MIEIRQLKKQYKGTTVVDVAELRIQPGESFGLVGNNGAGKTTLFRLILDLIRPTAGEVTIDGRNVQGQDDWKRYVGSFLDEGFLISYLTPDEYFRFVGGLHGYSEADVQALLTRFEVLFNGEIRGQKKYIRELSKGNQKKVGIAAAMIGHPQVVMLDEPFENLDPTSQIRLKDLLKREREERKLTYLISSHDLNHVTDICDRIVILEKGQVLKDLRGGPEVLRELQAYFSA
jgi:ABC-2 type transport system ATP-binding protein